MHPKPTPLMPLRPALRDDHPSRLHWYPQSVVAGLSFPGSTPRSSARTMQLRFASPKQEPAAVVPNGDPMQLPHDPAAFRKPCHQQEPINQAPQIAAFGQLSSRRRTEFNPDAHPP